MIPAGVSCTFTLSDVTDPFLLKTETHLNANRALGRLHLICRPR
jgi:hypothetical protein